MTKVTRNPVWVIHDSTPGGNERKGVGGGRGMFGLDDGLLYGMGNIGTAGNIKIWKLSGSISGRVSQECGSVRAADGKS